MAEKEKKIKKEDDGSLKEWGKALMIIGEGLVIFSKVIDEIEEME